MEPPREVKPNPIEVLIVEDSATQAEQLKYLLDEDGYSAIVASDAKRALVLARKHKPSLIMSDIVMPEMDGYTLCKMVKADSELKDIPVLLLTSLTGAEEVLKALQCGADNFVRKPFDHNRLLKLIEYMLTNRELRRSGKMQVGLEIEIGGERNRGLYVLKSRGMAHSNQIREFKLTDHGIELLDVYVGPEGVLTGSARLSQEAKNDAEQLLRQQEIERKQFGLELKRAATEAQIVVLRSEFKADESETFKIIEMEKAKTERFAQDQKKMAESRKADKFIKKPV